MDNLVLVVAVFAFAFLLLYLFNSLKDNPKQQILRVIIFFVVIGTLFYFPKIAMDDQYVCEVVVNFTSDEKVYKYGNNYTGYHWDYVANPPNCNPSNELDCVNLFHTYTNTTYDYDEHCYYKNGTTPQTFQKSVTMFYFVVMIYVLMFILWNSWEWIWKRKRGENEENKKW